jgi:hypothetical protein
LQCREVPRSRRGYVWPLPSWLLNSNAWCRASVPAALRELREEALSLPRICLSTGHLWHFARCTVATKSQTVSEGELQLSTRFLHATVDLKAGESQRIREHGARCLRAYRRRHLRRVRFSSVPSPVHPRRMCSGTPNGSLTQPRRGPVCHRQSGAPLAATNVKTAGSVCKRRDAAHLGRKEGLQPRANERPAVGCSEKLARPPPPPPIVARALHASWLPGSTCGNARAVAIWLDELATSSVLEVPHFRRSHYCR